MTPKQEWNAAVNGDVEAQERVYLTYVNDFMSVSAFAKYYGVTHGSAILRLQQWYEDYNSKH